MDRRTFIASTASTVVITGCGGGSSGSDQTVAAQSVPLQISSGSTLTAATVGTVYSDSISATGGTPPYTWSITSDAPDTGSWLSINSSTGALSGTPGTAETETVVVKVTDSASNTASKSFSLVVNAAGNATPLSITTTSPLPGATVGTAYAETLAAVGGTPPYIWSVTSDTPDSGSWLSINSSTGALSGTPGTAETETIVVKVTDSASKTASMSFSLTVAAQGASGAQAYDGVIQVSSAGLLVNGANQPLKLMGQNLSGLEFAAEQGDNPDDPWNGAMPVSNWAVLKTWGINVVRIPLNTASWLGLTTWTTNSAGTAWAGQQNAGIGNGTADPGGNYKQTLYDAIALAQSIGCYVILDCHLTAPEITLGGTSHYLSSLGQTPFMDMSTSLPFWESIAQIFGTQATPPTSSYGPISNKGIIFELYNEPYMDQIGGTQSAGSPDLALLNGGTNTVLDIPGVGYVNYTWELVGYQQVLNAIRGYGATNVCLCNGNGYATGQQGRSTWMPTDTLSPKQLGTGWHPYTAPNTTYASYQSGNAGYPGFYPNTIDPGATTSTAVQYAQATMDAGYPLVCTEDGGFGGVNVTQTPPERHVQYMTQWVDSQTPGKCGYMNWEWTEPQPYGYADDLSNGGGDISTILASDGVTILPIPGQGTQFYYWSVNGSYTGAA